jgi:hypothetical protein
MRESPTKLFRKSAEPRRTIVGARLGRFAPSRTRRRRFSSAIDPPSPKPGGLGEQYLGLDMAALAMNSR